MNRGSSEFIGSGSHKEDTFFTRSSYQWSLSSFQFILLPVLLTTIVFLTSGHWFNALSTFDLRGTTFPPRIPSSAVITISQSASRILSFKDSGENPPKTTEWIAPILVQASIAKAASGIIGIYIQTLEPFETSRLFNTLENLHTSL